MKKTTRGDCLPRGAATGLIYVFAINQNRPSGDITSARLPTLIVNSPLLDF